MTVQQLMDRLNKNRIELDELSMSLCVDPKIKDFDFESVLSQILVARRLIEFSLQFLHKLHPETHFSFNDATKKSKAQLILLFKDKIEEVCSHGEKNN